MPVTVCCYVCPLFFSTISVSLLLSPPHHFYLSVWRWSSHCDWTTRDCWPCSRACTQVACVCVCLYVWYREREWERVLLQTRSINSSNEFDPSRLTAAINMSFPPPPPYFPHYLTRGRTGLYVYLWHTHTHTELLTWKNRARSNVLAAGGWKIELVVTYVPLQRSTLAVCPLLLF